MPTKKRKKAVPSLPIWLYVAMLLGRLPLKRTISGSLGLQGYGGLPLMARIILAGQVPRSVTGAKRFVPAIRYM